MKKIIITGGSDGIGLELAKLLAQKGNQLLLVVRNKEKLEKAIETLPGKEHRFRVSDLSKKEDVHAIADHISQNHYDVLVNNAGAGMYGRFEEMELSEQIKMVNLNIYALTSLSYHFIKNAKKGDSLVNIASFLGTTSFPGGAVYSATKAFVINFSEGLWWENKKRGIYVLGFCPGVTHTHFHETSGGSQGMFPEAITQTPMQVAEELVYSLEKRTKPKAVSGAMNRFMLFSHRFLSRKTVANMMGGFSPINSVNS
jgi:short-subunit dehydrogenase